MSLSVEVVEAQCALFRETLRELVDLLLVSALIHDPPTRETVHRAQRVLEADGLQALALQRLDQELQNHCYDLADWAYHEIYARPRNRAGYVPSRADIQRLLTQVEDLTRDLAELDATLQPEARP